MKQSSLCPKFEKGMQLLGKRWTGLILHQLLSGPQRFCAIEEALPISGRLLSERLKDLEKEGLVHRHVYTDSAPIRVEYSLTDKGLALKPVLLGIEQWSQTWMELDDHTST
ncbi:helix-turn-helix transcriptional regulator [Brevibacillus composti]|uniref:Helix-turn-helix transcriptional regulator n=1 Tax=Brevibacillus composti TaxID=2796470 RepID=A0A7T5EPP0_9BACL|nr:helix-turn-helix domain-containing protein [Brevibacillus composti]QQE76430.1 helix-turn-helix transcriptional regulator [Brevibacillus composti]QUO43508.1 helix-turn-helix transcriptional regulator [Brevibacillus composti]